jgi:hypothetical protein
LLGETHGETHWKNVGSRNSAASANEAQPEGLKKCVSSQMLSSTDVEIVILQRVLSKPLF